MKERFYDRLNGALDRKGFGERRDRLVGSPTGDVLEIGAGTGLNLPRYRRVARLVAVEPDPHYRRRLQARAHHAHVPAEVIDARAETLPFTDQSFDHVVTSICLCSVTDLQATLAEIHRVLRPGGSLAFLEHVRGTGRLGRWQDRLTPLQRRFAEGCNLNRDPKQRSKPQAFTSKPLSAHDAARTPPDQARHPRHSRQARPAFRAACRSVAGAVGCRERGMSGRLGSELRIDLLGGFRVAANEKVVDEAAWRLRKARSVVKLLALAPGHTLHREHVIEALWPDRDPAAASNNLRQVVFVARRALDSCGEDGAARIALVHDVLALAGERLRIDIEEFEAAAAQAERAPSVERDRQAIDLYAGELLPEDRYDEWAAVRRQALSERHLTLLVDLARLHEQAGDPAAALAALQQALVDEPLHERAHREIMRIYALTGRRQRALAQFHLLRESLRQEFEDEPDEQTRGLYRDILTRRLGAGDTSEQAPAARRADPAPRRAGNLPLQLTSFVGRERELAEVLGLARRHRLLTLTGPGGCGKTRLGLEAAASLLRDAADGVWLVELAGLSDGALVAPAVGGVLGVESRSTRPSEQALAAHVGEAQMLVVLDNCEHLVVACARLVEGLLTHCPNLRILATSREPLHIAGEVDWRVPSLAPSEATQLFTDRATAVSSRFVLSEENADAVAEICRRVDGIPLAIELAAARVGVLAPAQIAERLRDSLGVLAAGRRTALTRQQTLTATLDWSHQLLDDAERTLFRRLGAFAGSFDLAAVETVCAGELDVLAQLVDKSLVVVEEQDATARYRLLDTIRHYALERLAEAGERQALQARHRAHYLGLAEALERATDGPDARRQLTREADELRWALHTALNAEPNAALRLAAALWRFWHDRGDRTEGARWLRARGEISGVIRRVAGRVWRRRLAAIVPGVLEGEPVASGASRRRRSPQQFSRGS